MSKMSLMNASDDDLEVDVIRYFENNNNEYLIYSLNETVGDGYIKLYASKIIGNSAHIITDEEEWMLIKEIIKNIIKANHEGSELNVIDLDEEELANVILQDTRIFKLQGNLVNLLSDNKLSNKKEPVLPPIIDFDEEISEIDYEILYKEELEKNRELRDELKTYKEKMNKIVELVEE